MNMIRTPFRTNTMDFIKMVDELLNSYDMESYTTKDQDFSVEIPLPGLSKNEIELEVMGKTLTIKTKLNKPDGYLKRYQDYRYSYQLTDKYDLGKVEAAMTNGLLRIKVPLKEQKTESLKIDVK